MIQHKKISPQLLLKFLLILTFLTITHTFFITLPSPSPSLQQRKCFTSTVYKQQRLLIDVEIPMLQKNVDIGVEVSEKYKKSQQGKQKSKVVFTEIIKQGKYKKTVQKETHQVHQIKDDISMEYETCIFLKNRVTVQAHPRTDFDGSFLLPLQQKKEKQPQKTTYLISLKLLTSFTHVLEEKRSQQSSPPNKHSYTKEHLQTLKKQSSRLLQLAKQQIKIHRQNQRTQAKTQEHVKSLQGSIYSMSLMQSALLVFGSLMHINLMRSYMKGSGMI